MKKLWRLCLAMALSAGLAQAWDDRRLAEPLRVNGLRVPYPEFAIYVMPGSRLSLALAQASPAEVRFAGFSGELGSSELYAPQTPGLYPAHVRNVRLGEEATLNVFVLTPEQEVDEQGVLNGYRIGNYPETPLRDQPIYLPPTGFVEVTPENLQARVSPNFRLGDFLCKQESDFPKYLVLRASLLLKLETILAALNRSGRATEGFVVMSGYRTPWYNAAIGNGSYSRHIWGGAADIFIDDAPRDGQMDDLNGDGKIDRGDAEWLAEFINDMSHRGDFGPRIGGLGIYSANPVRGPFVHVDARGSRARW